MALSASIVWEFRTTATASMVNGGGYKSGGTDYSQQDAAQWTATDLACTAASTTITSATGGFTSAAVGNVIHITAGTNFTAGWYEITTYTNGTTLVLDRTPAPSLDGSSGTYYIGGALSLNSTLDDDFFDAVVAGNKIWVKSGSYTLGESVAMLTAGTAASMSVIEGYNATRGDAPTGTNRPTFACGSANSFATANYWQIHNLIFTGSATNVLAVNTNNWLINVKSTNSSATSGRYAIATATNGNTLLFKCEVISYKGTALRIIDPAMTVVGCYFHDSDIGIIQNHSQGSIFINNIFANNVTFAFRTTSAPTSPTVFMNNTFYGSENTTGTGLSFITGSIQIRVVNNIIYGFATGVAHADSQTNGFDDYNDYNNNDTDVSNWTKGANDSALAPQFTNVAQVTGTAGAFRAGNDALIDTSKDFTTLGVVANQDHIYIVSGTGATAGIYGITSISTTTNPNDTLVLTPAPGTNTTADKTYQITTGHNFTIGTNLKALGFPGAFQGLSTTGYLDIGAVQRGEISNTMVSRIKIIGL